MRYVGSDDDDKPVIIHDSSAALKQWRDAVGWRARAAMHGLAMSEKEALDVAIDFTLARPRTVDRLDAWTRPDLDKLTRAVLDAMEGIVYKQDAQVVSLRVSKEYGEPGARVIVTRKRP